MYKLIYTKQAAKDIKNLKAAHLDKKAKELIEIIRQNPFQNPPRYEAMVGNLHGFYSRRINIQHRIVYQVIDEKFIADDIEYEGIIKIIRMWTHYDNVR